MPYLIDGHNLIGKLPDIRLDEVDDEERLIDRLSAFCRAARKEVEVYFDRAAPGRAGRFRRGAVTAVFVGGGGSADSAIRNRLGQLGRSAPNWTIVSSDHAVQSAARLARARVMSSEAFSAALRATGSESGARQSDDLSEGELKEWLRLFGEKDEGV